MKTIYYNSIYNGLVKHAKNNPGLAGLPFWIDVEKKFGIATNLELIGKLVPVRLEITNEQKYSLFLLQYGEYIQ